jgi:hypothetical protein
MLITTEVWYLYFTTVTDFCLRENRSSIRRHCAVAPGALLAGDASGMADLSSPLAGLWQILTLIAGPVLSYGYLALIVTLTRTDPGAIACNRWRQRDGWR